MSELTPITREEMLMAGEDLTPITRKEMILAGEDIEPITREEMFLKEYRGGDAPTIRPWTGKIKIINNSGYQANYVTMQQDVGSTYIYHGFVAKDREKEVTVYNTYPDENLHYTSIGLFMFTLSSSTKGPNVEITAGRYAGSIGYTNTGETAVCYIACVDDTGVVTITERV